ncbi:M23 family metallopeptidase [Culicoidibacter larvae]|uniref:M23 family metallopeptidase n=1 Tax=Culicoidibacter larvae TaxID=2579976 RepID=A0A5R8Q7F9_9FIRM|nr:M23 family metallopeptidase [Culicoidibacter larvae]TLG71361.1 M23 family metallopeptidase [Culicoidibacter larvae]
MPQIYSKAHKKQVAFTGAFDNRTWGNGVKDWVGMYGYSMSAIPAPYQGHGGIDVVGGDGAAIYAVTGGEVVHAGHNGNAGIEVRIWTGSQMHRYLHLSRAEVSVGAKVSEGFRIGAEGSSGGDYPVHLHFEVWRSNNSKDKIDPYNILQQGGSGTGGSDGENVTEIEYVTDISKWDKNSTKLGIYLGSMFRIKAGQPMFSDQGCKTQITTTRLDGKTFNAVTWLDEWVSPVHLYKNTMKVLVTDQLGKQWLCWMRL